MNINFNELENKRIVIKTSTGLSLEITEVVDGKIILSVGDVQNVLKITPMAMNSIRIESTKY